VIDRRPRAKRSAPVVASEVVEVIGLITGFRDRQTADVLEAEDSMPCYIVPRIADLPLDHNRDIEPIGGGE